MNIIIILFANIPNQKSTVDRSDQFIFKIVYPEAVYIPDRRNILIETRLVSFRIVFVGLKNVFVIVNHEILFFRLLEPSCCGSKRRHIVSSIRKNELDVYIELLLIKNAPNKK